MSCWAKYSIAFGPLGRARFANSPAQRRFSCLAGADSTGNAPPALLPRLPVLLPSRWFISAPMDPSIEIVFRLGIAVAVFAVMAAWEVLAPRRPLSAGRLSRWPGNFGIVVVDALLVRLLVPTAVVGASLYAAGHGLGLFHWFDPRLSVAAV